MNLSTRRDALVRIAAIAGAMQNPAAPLLNAEPYPRNLTAAEIERWGLELSNWGRWGSDDQAGTINLITPAKRAKAAALVKEGVSVSLALNADFPPQAGSSTAHTWEHVMAKKSIGPQDGYVLDRYTISFHNSVTTHVDSFSHYFLHGKTYNGFSIETITEWGSKKNDIMPFQSGFLTRGVLVDLPVLKSVPYLADDEPIFVEDLIAWERKMGVKVESGDALFFRTGRWARGPEKEPLTPARMPGLYASCAKWLRQRDVAILGSDVVQDVHPSRVDGLELPIHQLLLVNLGMPLIDSCDLEALSQACKQRHRWTFLFTAAPLRAPGATGSPLNPIATF